VIIHFFFFADAADGAVAENGAAARQISQKSARYILSIVNLVDSESRERFSMVIKQNYLYTVNLVDSEPGR